MELSCSIYCLSVADQLLNFILSQIQSSIQQIQLVRFVPQYLSCKILTELQSNLTAYQPNYSGKTGSLIEEFSGDVPKIGLDNLVPKNVVQEIVPNDDLREMSRSTRIVSPKLSLKRKKTSFMGTQMPSKALSITEEPNKRQSISSFPSNQQNPKKQSLFISLPAEPEDNEDFKAVRATKQSIVRQWQRVRDLNKQNQKKKQQRIEEFAAAYGSKNYTFDFDGDVVDTDINSQQKIKYNGIKSKMGGLIRKMREDLKLEDQTSKSLNLKKSLRKIVNPDRISATQHIPMPQQTAHKGAVFGLPLQLSQYKLQEYRKYYGGKFHRTDISTRNTIDVVKHDAEDPHQDLFSSRRDIKDKNRESDQKRSLNASRYHGITRRIALPKLKGNYKVLDRYQEY